MGCSCQDRLWALLPSIGKEVKIHTYLNVKEDAMQLYGFLTKDDLEVFKLLIGVNGIGPKGGLGVLSALSPDELRFAVMSSDVKAICQAPGIGKKTAEKLILELRDKLRLEDAKDQLADIKKMKPISYNDNTKPTTKPTTKPSTTSSGSVKPKEELGNKSFLELGGAGTAGDPKIFWVRQSQVFNDKFIAELLGEAKELYTILEVRRNDKAAGVIVSRTGVLFQAVEETVNTGSAVSTAFAQEGESYGVHLLTDVTQASHGNGIGGGPV